MDTENVKDTYREPNCGCSEFEFCIDKSNCGRTKATDADLPEILREFAGYKSLNGHPFVRVALRNAADVIDGLQAENATMKPIYDKYAHVEAIPSQNDIRRAQRNA